MSSPSATTALDYLESLPGLTFAKLYAQPSTALAVFRRMLPHLAKTVVMSMLYLPGPMRAADLEAWFKSDVQSGQERERSVSVLVRLKVLVEEQAGGGAGLQYRLSEAFAKGLRCALTGAVGKGDAGKGSFGVACSAEEDEDVNVKFLDDFARRQWEAILYYVVGSANSGLSGDLEISAGTKRLLQQGNFVQIKSGGKQRLITQAGFTFLLEEVNAQVWSLAVVYLRVCEDLQMDPVDVLSFLFTLGSLELGIPYSTSNLTPTQQHMLDDLQDFGLIYRSSPTATAYYPTRLATTLTSDAPALPNNTSSSSTTTAATESNEKGYIILETNYRLYAYTSSPLQISILSLFSTLHTRYPNLITAKITKSSIASAISQSITSDQIITYLSTHAHPVLRRQAAIMSAPILPPTVVDQIRLWQIEGERMTTWKGFYIRDVGGWEEYVKAVEYAEALGVLRQRFDAKRSFFVGRMDQMAGYFKLAAERRRRERDGAGGANA
ncbi:RNA polymerase II transcription factor B subunit 2 like protein [Zymoseptoria brevis]|uniref:RNA polymerase II transcription factor B subunit 2 n=1 Tax=Zymoseptoria brevis TaxID=1047168 RepID=A0A0F4GAR5_9PEZI|nr:RNA polymerase II transcription factor B subunit 2 like protein [Zymoseptoria brevis]